MRVSGKDDGVSAKQRGVSAKHDCLLCADEPECSRFTPEGRAQHLRISARMREPRHAPWSPLVWRDDPSYGARWFLDGKPIHCGAGFELQRRVEVLDEGDEFSLWSQESLGGRFEVAWTLDESEMRRDGKVPMFHVGIGGYEFKRAIESWMRFRWGTR